MCESCGCHPPLLTREQCPDQKIVIFTENITDKQEKGVYTDNNNKYQEITVYTTDNVIDDDNSMVFTESSKNLNITLPPLASGDLTLTKRNYRVVTIKPLKGNLNYIKASEGDTINEKLSKYPLRGKTITFYGYNNNWVTSM
jgi:hypothetical protein